MSTLQSLSECICRIMEDYAILSDNYEIMSHNYEIVTLCILLMVWEKCVSIFSTSGPAGLSLSACIPPAGWWSCCPLCTSLGIWALPLNVCLMPRLPVTRLSTVCCGSSTGRSWSLLSAGFWERSTTCCLPTVQVAHWTPQMTTALPGLPELSVLIFKWFSACTPSAKRSEVRVFQKQLPCRWKRDGTLLKDT